MPFHYKLQRLCGAAYGIPPRSGVGASSSSGGSNILYTASGNAVVSPVSNRIQVVDLESHTIRTLPVEARSNIALIALSPSDDRLLLILDSRGYASLVNFARGVVLHRFRFSAHSHWKVRACEFSPNGRFVAVALSQHVQVWHSPGMQREVSPFVKVSSFTASMGDDVVGLCWSSDSTVLMGYSRDTTVRIWTVQQSQDGNEDDDDDEEYVPVTLSGHKGSVVGAYFEDPQHSPDSPRGDNRLRRAYSLCTEAALVLWKCVPDDEEAATADGEEQPAQGKRKSQAQHMARCKWSHSSRHFLNNEAGVRTVVTASAFSSRHNLLVVGFRSGVFGLYELPSVSNIHTLSISNHAIRTVAINSTGEWLAMGCPATQQLLVWEWRSESYIIKQKGHAYGMRCMAYSPDGVVIATGGEDGSLKLWNATNGLCYCTMTVHTAPVTACVFANSSVVLTGSLDGTVRAHDLHRYRNFKTLTGPKPTQFLSLAVDPSGDIVTAGTSSSGSSSDDLDFAICVWSLQTGKLLDVLAGHAGPVSALAFHPLRGTLASGSWDASLKLWDIYKSDTNAAETIRHTADVVCLCFSPDGTQLCTGTLGGLLSFWKVEEARLEGEIDGRRDIAGGRKINDRMTSDNNAASRYFTTVSYSADGNTILAGGNSKYICIYAVSSRLLLKRFQISFNRSLDGVLDELNSKNLGDDGVPMDNESDDSDDDEGIGGFHLPGAKRSDDGSRKSRVEVLTLQVAFSSTGREWAAVSNEGLHIYALDNDLVFDPLVFSESVTPHTVQSHLRQAEYGKALRVSLHLHEDALIRQVLEATPFSSIRHVVSGFAWQAKELSSLMTVLAQSMAESPHVEFYVEWCLQVLQQPTVVEKQRSFFLPVLRGLHKALLTRHEQHKQLCDENRFTLDFLQHQLELWESTNGSTTTGGGGGIDRAAKS